MAPGERTMKKEMTLRWRSEEAERVIDELAKERERNKAFETENAQLKVEMVDRRCLEEAQGVIKELEQENAQLKKKEKMPWWCVEEAQGVIDELTKEKEKNKAFETENAQLKQELEARVTDDGTEGETSSRGKRRRRTTEASEDATIPELPTEIWTKIAAKITEDDDALAFALTSRQLRVAQQQAGRKLVTRPFWKDNNGKHHQAYFSRDWCIWWSRRFNMTETEPACMNCVIRVAARSGYLDVLTTYWSDIPENKIPLLMDRWTCAWAASGGHLGTLQWLRSQGCMWDKHTCHWAAANGHLEVLQWARIQGCPWSKMTSSSAAANGHLEILQFLLDNGCPWDDNICANAAQNGHLNVLRYLRQAGCPSRTWNANTTLRAAEGGHLEVLQWLRCVGCLWSEEECHRRGKPNIVRWIDELRAL